MKRELKPRGSVAKEDPKTSHQLYKVQIKSTWSARQILSMEKLYIISKVISLQLK